MSAITTGQQVQDVLARLVGSGESAADTLVGNVFQVRWSIHKPLDAAATTAQTWCLDPSTDVRVQITSVKFLSHATITSENTNNAIFTLAYDNGNGGADTTVATANLATALGGGLGDVTADIPIAIPVATNANAVIPAGSNVMFKITKTATTGMSVPAGSFIIKGKYI